MRDGRRGARESRRGFLTTAAGAIGLTVAGSAASPAPAGAAEAATGQTVRDRLWIFTCVAGADNEGWGLPRPSRMTPAEGALYLGVPNLLLIRWQGKPTIPFLANTVCDLELESVEWTRRWIADVGPQPLEPQAAIDASGPKPVD